MFYSYDKKKGSMVKNGELKKASDSSKGEYRLGVYTFEFGAREDVKFVQDKFFIQGKECTIDFFKGRLIQEIGKDAAIYQDKTGRGVLRICKDIPVFDSDDCRYDRYEVIYLFEKKKGLFEKQSRLMGYCFHGGYEFSWIRLYQDVSGADSRTQQLLDEFRRIAHDNQSR